MNIADESTMLSAMQSAHQASVVARASRCLIECHSLESFLCCAHKTLQDLGCSGFAQFQCGEESRHIKFGDTIRLHQRAAQQGPDIYVDNTGAGQFTYRAEKILLIVDVEYCSPRDSDILKDNVAIFADSMSAWLAGHVKFHQESMASIAEKAGVVAELNNVTNFLYSINDNLLEAQRHVCEDLLTQLLAAFPAISLDPDQENKILDIVSLAIDSENKLFGSQIRQNMELRASVEHALSVLSPAKKNLCGLPLTNDDVVLFN